MRKRLARSMNCGFACLLPLSGFLMDDRGAPLPLPFPPLSLAGVWVAGVWPGPVPSLSFLSAIQNTPINEFLSLDCS